MIVIFSFGVRIFYLLPILYFYPLVKRIGEHEFHCFEISITKSDFGIVEVLIKIICISQQKVKKRPIDIPQV